MRTLRSTARRLFSMALWVLILGIFGGIAAIGANAASSDVRLAAVPPGSGDADQATVLPAVLPQGDAERYVRIFTLQDKGDWHAADDEIKRLKDRLLMGHVMAQRFLHPTAYRSKFAELKTWLASYNDHPQARRIYRLAMRRKPADAKAPKSPVAPTQPALSGDRQETPDDSYISPRKRTKAQRSDLIKLIAHIRGHIRKGDTKGAAKHLNGPKLLALADAVEYDVVRAEIAHLYFLKGDDKTALRLAGKSIQRSGGMAPGGYWTAGLAAYRQGDFETARRHFEGLALSADAPGDLRAGGGYWAARLNLATRRPERVSRLLRIAADDPTSFYGLLATRALGETADFTAQERLLTKSEWALIGRIPSVLRAIALAEAGDAAYAIAYAEIELKRLNIRSSALLAKAALALATQLGLPATQLTAARALTGLDGRRHNAGLYPVPRWEPEVGYRVDKALIFAVMRQESAFNPRAKSRSGARGLMQLMPRTAAFIARDRRLRSSRRHYLFDPEFNIGLGQKYLLHLFGEDVVGGDVMLAVAAYNGGPGNLNKWLRKTKYNDDPLLFMEALPARETRLYVKQVMTNLWMYRARFDQDAPSLDAIAGGRWPTYAPQDAAAIAYSVNGGN